MQKAIASLLVPLACALAADAPQSSPPFSDDFNRTALGPAWEVVWKDFGIVDGTMRDGGVEFRFQLSDNTSINAVWNDRDYKESHGGHLCRVALAPKQIRLGDDKEGLRHEIVAMKKDPAKKAEVARLTAGRTLAIPRTLEAGRWYRLRAEIAGDTLTAWLDGEEIGRLKSSGIAHATKKDFHFTLTGPEARIDDFRAWASPSP